MFTIKNLRKKPFDHFSAEDEVAHLRDIFYKQQYYDEILDLSETSASRFILGQRGQGKSAIIHHLRGDLSAKNVLNILISRYDGFPSSNNKNYYLYLMIRELTFELIQHLTYSEKDYKKLNQTQKEQLAFYVELFYDPQTASDFIKQSKGIKSKCRWNSIYRFINNNLKFLNNIIGIGVNVGKDLIREKAGIDVDFSSVGTEYIKGFNLATFSFMPMQEVAAFETDKLVKILKNLIDDAKSIGYKTVVVLFDQLDEVTGVMSDLQKVTDFTSSFLLDNNLLYTPDLSIVVSLWSEAKEPLSKRGVRFDKFKLIDLRWRTDELSELLDKRLKYYSVDQSNPVTFQQLVPTKYDRDLILELANQSPRSLLTLFSYIWAEERNDGEIESFSSTALSNGMLAFCKRFEYLTQHLARLGKGAEIVPWIERLLQLKKVNFSIKDYSEFFNIPQSTVTKNHIPVLRKYNLIEDSYFPGLNNETMFFISEPRVRFLISRGITSLRN